MNRPYSQHLSSAQDLRTTYEATRAGFVALALEKNRQATPFVEQARALRSVASRASTPAQLLNMHGIRQALLTASGVSDKAGNHLTDEDKTDAIRGLIENFLEPAGNAFVEELVYRFLLTRGDSLGGAMRNIAGTLAERRLTRAILSALSLAGVRPYWLHRETRQWAPLPSPDADVELYAKGLSWRSNVGHRTIVYNVKVPLVGTNVDLCLLRSPHIADIGNVLSKPGLFIAMGELKGGIDPAGADEHWKTANSALGRIRAAFAKREMSPALFFVGAAIENSMADEIWDQLVDGRLSNAANLTDAAQVASLSAWLCSL